MHFKKFCPSDGQSHPKRRLVKKLVTGINPKNNKVLREKLNGVAVPRDRAEPAIRALLKLAKVAK